MLNVNRNPSLFGSNCDFRELFKNSVVILDGGLVSCLVANPVHN
jgi:hypothetical protein